MYENIKQLFPEYKGKNGGRFVDMTGQRFGSLTVLYRGINTSVTDTHVKWVCQCDCGNVRLYTSNDLRRGKVISCGCNRRKQAGERNFINEIGNRHGRLLVIRQAESTDQGNAMWECLCDCGNYVTVLGTRLRNHQTMSCGCLNSRGNMYVGQILTSLGYGFDKEYKFNDLLSNRGHHLRFDFYVKAETPFCIEYDGVQHYFPTFGEEHFIQQSENDELKNQYCQLNQIPLLRIPYWVNSYEAIQEYRENFINKRNSINN